MISIKNNIENYIIFLFFLFPFFLISGPFLSDFFVVLLSLFFLINKNILKNCKSNLFIFFLIFYFYLNINSFFSFNSSISFWSSIPYIRFILFSFVLSYFLNKVLNLRKIIFFSFFLSYIILFLDSILQLSSGYNILGNPLITNRISSLFGDKLVMGSFVARSLPILLAISFIEDFKNKRIINALVLIISGSLIFFSSERLAFAYYFITIFLFIILTINKRNLFYYLFFIIAALCLLFFAKPSSWNRIVNHTISQIKNASNGIGISYRHELHYFTAYKLFLDEKIFGHGLKSFRNLCDKEKYNLNDKIISDNKLLSPFDGFLYLSQEDNFIVPLNFFDNNKVEFDPKVKSHLDKVYKLPNYYNKGINIILKKNGDIIKKGEIVGSFYEFKNGCNTHPHNIHLEFLSELGLIGYSFLMMFFIYVIFKIIKVFIYIVKNFNKKIKQDKYILYSLFILVGLFNSLFPLFPSGSFFNNWLSIIFYFNVGFLINIKNN
jgi:O-antigen ligase